MSPAAEDHPRSRGVYSLTPSSWSQPTGSSPLARGLRVAGAALVEGDGIIPARAGFTAPQGPPTRILRDHPRSRGVYNERVLRVVICSGSSPLARGLLCRTCARRFTRGIIPARAGFTFDLSMLLHANRDHPRSRGVYLHGGPGRQGRLGSSPLARGLRQARRIHHQQGRIIPARAGFTRPHWRRAGR